MALVFVQLKLKGYIMFIIFIYILFKDLQVNVKYANIKLKFTFRLANVLVGQNT